MNIFGFDITRTKAIPGTLSSPSSRGWWPIVREPFSGAWQRNVEWTNESVLTFHAVFGCIRLITSDIGKLRIRLVSQDGEGIQTETDNPAYSPVLRKPNHYQTRIKFIEEWISSKLVWGNAYILKSRDNRRVVTAMYVLNPTRVRPLVAPDGSVFYQLNSDQLSGVGNEGTIVPASELIHDVDLALYHPLVGVSRITACGLAATQGLRAQENSATFFANGSNPGGVLTAPGVIHEETANRLKDKWEQEFSGLNQGRVAVLGDGLHYEPMMMKATDAQFIEQLKITAEMVCTAFGVPPYKVGVGPPPNYNNVEALNVEYYSGCLQTLIECVESLLDEGLDIKKPMKTDFNRDDLLRMDTISIVNAASTAIKSGAVAINEARKRWLDLPALSGGDTPLLQEQNWPLDQIASRDLPTRPITAPAQLPETAEAVKAFAHRFGAGLRRKSIELGLAS